MSDELPIGWATAQPVRAKDNSPAIYRCVYGWNGNKSRLGRKNTRSSPSDFFRPYRSSPAAQSTPRATYSRNTGSRNVSSEWP